MHCIALLVLVLGVRIDATAQDPPASHLRLATQIGADGGDSRGDIAFGMISDVAMGARGEILVVDLMEGVVHVFDGSGSHVRTFGRQGAGPGEFIRPMALTIDSVIRVYDPAQNRVSTFTLVGSHLETRHLPTIRGLNVTRMRPLANGGWLGVTTPGLSFGGSSHQESVTVVIEAPVTRRLDTIQTYHSGATIWYTPDRAAPWGVATSDFGPGGAWAISGDTTVVVIDGIAGTVRWFDATSYPLRVARTAALGARGRRVSGHDRSMVADQLRTERADRGRTMGRFELITPSHWSVAIDALFSDDGTLWIHNGTTSEGGQEWTLLPVDDAPQRVVRLPSRFRLRRVRGRSLIGVFTLESGAEVVRVYEWLAR